MAEEEGKHGQKANHRDPGGDAKLERCSSDEPMAEKKTQGFTSRVRITFVHYRKRLIDYDNLCTKAVLDKIVRVGILRDDSPKEVEEVIHKQVKSEKEKTLVIIEEVDES